MLLAKIQAVYWSVAGLGIAIALHSSAQEDPLDTEGDVR